MQKCPKLQNCDLEKLALILGRELTSEEAETISGGSGDRGSSSGICRRVLTTSRGRCCQQPGQCTGSIDSV